MASRLLTFEVMEAQDPAAVDLHLCRARIGLSLFSFVSMYVDPMVGGLFAIDPPALFVLALHLAYSLFAYLIVTRRVVWASHPLAFAVADVLFASAIAVVTEGVTSPAYVFFGFAIIAAAFRQGWRATARITLASMSAYLVSILALSRTPHPEWLMRPGYLGLIGLLAGSLGQQRMDFESRVRELEAAAERRNIARSLHDGYVQALAGTRLRLEACRGLLRRGDSTAAIEELVELQSSVTREYDEVRSYIRSLAAMPVPTANGEANRETPTRFRVLTDFVASGPVTEQVLQILLEGIRNTLRHGRAVSASLDVHGDDSAIRIRVDDDGVGFRPETSAPWSIASRVTDLGGSLEIEHGARHGAHLQIELPRSRA